MHSVGKGDGSPPPPYKRTTVITSFDPQDFCLNRHICCDVSWNFVLRPLGNLVLPLSCLQWQLCPSDCTLALVLECSSDSAKCTNHLLLLPQVPQSTAVWQNKHTGWASASGPLLLFADMGWSSAENDRLVTFFIGVADSWDSMRLDVPSPDNWAPESGLAWLFWALYMGLHLIWNLSGEQLRSLEASASLVLHMMLSEKSSLL